MESKSIKRMLILVVTTTLFCVALFIGATFAWMSANSGSTGNKINSGKLEVFFGWLSEENMSEQQGQGEVEYIDLKEVEITLYEGSELWQSGDSRTDYFLIRNDGTLAAQYKLTFQNLSIYTSPDGYALGDAIGVFIDGVYTTNLSRYDGGKTLVSGTVLPGEERSVTIQLMYWAEAEDEYQGLPLTRAGKDFDILLTAVQPNAQLQIETPNTAVTCADFSFILDQGGKKATITAYNGDSLTPVVPGRIGEAVVISIGDGINALCGTKPITGITLPKGLLSIASNAFSGCTTLGSIELPSGLVTVGANAFAGCTGITSLTIPSTVTTIGASAFSGCTQIVDLNLNEGLTTINGYAFSGCTSINALALPNSLTSLGANAFSGCTSIASLSIGSGLTVIPNGAFKDFKALLALEIPGTVTTIGVSAFQGCVLIESLDVPMSVTLIDAKAFSGCSSLSTITIPSNVTTINASAFNGCSAMTSIVFEDSSSTWTATKTVTTGGTTSTLTESNISVSNAALNATNLVTNYCDYVWTRN